MIKYGNFGLCGESFTTYRTLCSVGKTCFGTCRSLAGNGFTSVTKRIGIVTNVTVVTCGTSISGVTCSGTSRIGYYSFVAVTKCGNFGLCGESFTTYGAPDTVSKTCFGAGRSLTGDSVISMTGRGNTLLSYDHGTTYGTVLAFGKTCLGTGRSLSRVDRIGVTESISLISNVAIATRGASIRGVTAVSTVGISHYRLVIVRVGAVGNGKVITRIVGTLDGGVILYLNALSVSREVKHSNHTLGAVVIFSIHALRVDEDLCNLIAVKRGLLSHENAVNVGVSADNHRYVGVLREELIPKLISRVVVGIVSSRVSALPGLTKSSVALEILVSGNDNAMVGVR